MSLQQGFRGGTATSYSRLEIIHVYRTQHTQSASESLLRSLVPRSSPVSGRPLTAVQSLTITKREPLVNT